MPALYEQEKALIQQQIKVVEDFVLDNRYLDILSKTSIHKPNYLLNWRYIPNPESSAGIREFPELQDSQNIHDKRQEIMVHDTEFSIRGLQITLSELKEGGTNGLFLLKHTLHHVVSWVLLRRPECGYASHVWDHLASSWAGMLIWFAHVRSVNHARLIIIFLRKNGLSGRDYYHQASLETRRADTN